MNIRYLLRCAALVCAAVIPALVQADVKDEFTPSRKIELVQRIIEQCYVEPVNGDSIAEEGIRAMLRTLDPHSQYSTPKETREFTEPLQGNFSGIGIQFNLLTDTIYVIQTIAGGPSERVGLLPGDRIVTVNDSVVAGIKLADSEVKKRLRGPKGTEVRLGVQRRGVPELLSFTVVRDDIPITSIDAAYMAEPGTGYIKIARFGETTADEFAEALADLKSQGMKRLMIDLQGNGGGYLKAAFDIAAMLLPKNRPVVYTEGLHQPRVNYGTDRDGDYRKIDLAVLVDQYSASASEILAGAVQDNDRGIIVGRRTYGKGLVQRPFNLPDGSMVRLTTAHYYTPSGRSIQKPYSSGDDSNYSADIVNRLKSGELTSADSVKLDMTQRYETLVKHRPVYGGGGIMPDVFVALDTAFFTPLYRDLLAQGIYNRWTQEYVDARRPELSAHYPTVQAFEQGFEVTDEMVGDLLEAGRKAGVTVPDEGLAQASEDYIRVILKALIARDLYDATAYYRIANSASPIYREALEVF